MKKFEKDEVLNPVENIRIERKHILSHEKVAAHTHDFAEFVYVLNGKAKQYINGIAHEVQRGDFMIINYNQTHAFEAEESFTYVDILLEPQFMSTELLNTENIFEIFSIAMFKEFESFSENTPQFISFSGRHMFEIENIINNMIIEFEEKDTGYLSIISGYMRVVFSMVLRKMGTFASESYMHQTKINAEIIEYIDAHCHEKISLSYLAEKSFYNPAYFSHAFKKYCGKSLKAYVKEKRVMHAVDMLEATDYSISSIGELVGYEDKTSFYKAFKEITGKTPAKYREELKNNN